MIHSVHSMRRLVALAVASGVVSGWSGPAWGDAANANPRDLIPPSRPSGGNGYPGMGLILSGDAAFGSTSSFRISRMARGIRPRKVILTDFLPPVRHQGKQGSCAAWAVAYYNYSYGVARGMQLTPENRDKPRFQFSPAYLYNAVNKGKDGGMSLAAAFQMLKDKGCASLAEMPYNPTNTIATPSELAEAKAQKFKARGVAHLFTSKPDLDSLKTFLADVRQPFCMAIVVFKDFPRTKVSPDYVYHLTLPPSKANVVGGHAITVVGYDDTKHAFRIVNSWGAGWGDQGFLWLSEDFVRDWALEGWGSITGGPIVRSPFPTRHVSLVPPEKEEKH